MESTFCLWATFALRIYQDDPCTCFKLKGPEKPNQSEMEMDLRMHKAISIIQFKVEGQLITRQKNMRLESRALLVRLTMRREPSWWTAKSTRFWIPISPP